MHGDIVATADEDIEATELLSTQSFDEYGNPKEGNPKAELTSKSVGWALNLDAPSCLRA